MTEYARVNDDEHMWHNRLVRVRSESVIAQVCQIELVGGEEGDAIGIETKHLSPVHINNELQELQALVSDLLVLAELGERQFRYHSAGYETAMKACAARARAMGI